MAETRRDATICLIHFKVENINDDVSSVVQQNNVATNYDVHAVRWWRRQTSFQFHWAGLDTLLEPGRQRIVPDKLFFQSWRELIFLRQDRRKVSLILGIPAADGFFIVMFIVMVGMLVIIITVVFIVALSCAWFTAGFALTRNTPNAPAIIHFINFIHSS
jgi:hypothetical protein